MNKMFRSLQKIVSPTSHALQRTASGLDTKHLAAGNYLFKNFIRNNPEKAELLPYHGGGHMMCLTKKPHPSNQKHCRSSDHSTNCSQPPASQKNSSSPPTKSSP